MYSFHSERKLLYAKQIWRVLSSPACFPSSSMVKCPPANPGRRRFCHWVGKSPWRRNGNPPQYSSLGDPVERDTWWTTVHGVAKESDMTWQLNHSNSTYRQPWESDRIMNSSVWRQKLSAGPFTHREDN